jgi:[ribosomal protein S5]-alanine N-acetyltransferase
MLTIRQATSHQLSILLDRSKYSEISGLRLPIGEEVAPRFLLELIYSQLNQDPGNSFWWCPWFVVVDGSIVGMASFKNPPDNDGSVEIGYGIVPLQQNQGFATQAIDLLAREGFLKTEIQRIVAYTEPSNLASCRVLEKNQFIRNGSKIDLDDGEVWIWQRTR